MIFVPRRGCSSGVCCARVERSDFKKRKKNIASIANPVQCHSDCQSGSQLSEIVNMFTNNVTFLSLHFSVFLCWLRNQLSFWTNTSWCIQKSNWEHSFEHWYWLVKDLQFYALKNQIKEMASDENKMEEEVKEKKDARPCGRLAKVILTGFWFLPGKV